MRLSVLLSIYRLENPDYLESSLASIWCGQQLRPDEIVLVIDGPVPERLQSVIETWRSRIGPPLRPIWLKENQGLGGALRVGLNACNGEFVARIDADDMANCSRFQKQIDFLSKNPQVDILGTCATLIDKEGAPIGKREVPVCHAEIRRLIWSCPIIHPSVMYRRARIVEVGSYSADIARRQEDYDLWIRALRKGLIFHNMPESLTLYRAGDGFKNDWRVGWHRLRIGWSAVKEFDPRCSSYLGICYPLVRGLLPRRIRGYLIKMSRHWDPRNSYSD